MILVPFFAYKFLILQIIFVTLINKLARISIFVFLKEFI